MGAKRLALSAKQIQACELLASGLSYAAIAAALDINSATISKWLRTPAFALELGTLRRQVYGSTSAAIAAAALDAVAVLRFIATDPDAPLSARVSAASKLLDAATKTAQLDAQWDPVTVKELANRAMVMGIKADEFTHHLLEAWRVDTEDPRM